jgi:molybdenum cofactor cytidylyltransferase
MGSSKQLLKWGEGTLLRHAVKTAMGSGAGQVFVVLGSDENTHRQDIRDMPVTIVSNPGWAKGMGSSLKAGLAVAKDTSDAVLFMVCDMPFVTSQHLNNILEHFDKTHQPVVASKYGKATGVPALFGKDVYQELSAIGDEEGARKVIAKHKYAAHVYLRSAEDIDTLDDYQRNLGKS